MQCDISTKILLEKIKMLISNTALERKDRSGLLFLMPQGGFASLT